MLAFLKARIPGPDGKLDAKKSHGILRGTSRNTAPGKLLAARPLTGGFAGTTYWGVHSFPATNSKGETRFIEFKVVPASGDVTLPKDAAKAKSADFLHDDLDNRIPAGDVRFNVMALLDRPGDPTRDVTIRWPDEDSREAVRLGTIVITAVGAERCVRRVHLRSGKTRRRHRSSAGRDLCGAARRLRHLAGEASLIGQTQFPLIKTRFPRAPCASRRHTAGADADHGRKHPRKMALIGKPGRHRNLGQRQIADGHQLLGCASRAGEAATVRRQAGGDSKRAGKMAHREAELGRDLLQREFSAEIGLEPFAGAPHLPRRKTAAGRSGDALQSAIGLRDVHGECQHHVIDEKLVGLGRPTQRLQERRADMTDDASS